jgi:hypothetical protein
MSKSFWGSKHRWTYIRIALKHFTTPQKVYDLAHGEREMHSADKSIMHELAEAKIVHRRKSAKRA